MLKIKSEFLKAGIEIKIAEPMSRHSTIKCGGNAKLYYEPKDLEQLGIGINILKNNNIKFMILGNGSNTLFKDDGFNGAVICINPSFFDVEFFDNKIYVPSGMLLKNVYNALYERGLSGFEFAAHIPATIGGAVYINAGCFDSSFQDIVESVLTYDYKIDDCKFKNNAECGFSYRHSDFQTTKEIILGAVLKLKPDDKENIKRKADKYFAVRKNTQPINYPSLGSVFKRGKDYFPAKLIEECKLKGLNIGGAEVSKLHSGFIVNKGCHESKNILTLIDTIKAKVYNVYKIELIEEIEIIGD